MCSFVSCGSVISRPSSVIMLYSNSLLVLALFLACHIMFGSFFVLLISFFISSHRFSSFPLPLLRP